MPVPENMPTMPPVRPDQTANGKAQTVCGGDHVARGIGISDRAAVGADQPAGVGVAAGHVAGRWSVRSIP
ncbi:hypothetical protein G6F65_022871 [Rhizopus arrhizus]|nr:hypothetical protein G6F65_022871 [Rhizopus arrhizus]